MDQHLNCNFVGMLWEFAKDLEAIRNCAECDYFKGKQATSKKNLLVCYKRGYNYSYWSIWDSRTGQLFLFKEHVQLVISVYNAHLPSLLMMSSVWVIVQVSHSRQTVISLKIKLDTAQKKWRLFQNICWTYAKDLILVDVKVFNFGLSIFVCLSFLFNHNLQNRHFFNFDRYNKTYSCIDAIWDVVLR